MNHSFTDAYHNLIAAISALPAVTAIGKSGGAQIPQPGESDIDLFVFCVEVPPDADRYGAASVASVAGLRTLTGRFWGTCDFMELMGVDVCLMYFTEAAMDAELDSVLRGERLDREADFFYPIGRCATMLSMHPLYDRDGYIARTQARLADYPAPLAEAMVARHIRGIYDEEDFDRAVSRGDVLFYHAMLDASIGHFLQALFALNRAYFPSRKRSLQHVAGFKAAPARCAERLLEVVSLGAKAETLAASREMWVALCEDLRGLVRSSMMRISG